MYNAPLTEDFVVTPERRIHPIKMRSQSGAVLEYLGISAAGDEHPRDRQFSSLSFLVAAKEPPTLIVGERTWSFRDFGVPGTRVEFNGGVDCTTGVQKSPDRVAQTSLYRSTHRRLLPTL